jgi:hypothetical protein
MAVLSGIAAERVKSCPLGACANGDFHPTSPFDGVVSNVAKGAT